MLPIRADMESAPTSVWALPDAFVIQDETGDKRKRKIRICCTQVYCRKRVIIMKLLFMIGNAAVGKMTVGQELMKLTGLRLFHNHMTIEPVIEIFGQYNGKAINRLRQVVFEEFAKSDCYGMIFTYMWDFDQKADWDYVEYVKSIFEPYNTEFYYVELVAPRDIRLERNITENRLQNKASKRDIEVSNQRLINDDTKYRLESFDGEIPFDNYIKIDNSQLPPDVVAKMIQEKFNL